MVISELELYEMLRPTLGETEARALISRIEENQKAQQTKVQTIEKELVVVQKDISQIQEDRKSLATKVDIAELRTEMAKLRTEMAEMKTEIVRWVAILAGVLLTGIKLIPSAPWA